jgi:hypothetical protein
LGSEKRVEGLSSKVVTLALFWSKRASWELERALNSCKPTNSPGHDGIQYWLFKNFLDIVSPILLSIFNACLSLQYFPVSWKSALVLVLRKPKKNDYTRPENYRPISLLCTMGKLLEKIINNRLRWLSEKFLWFSPSQHGFRQNKSTITALSSFVSDIENGFNTHFSTVSILLDIKGAFDNAWHPAVITSLVTRGCPGYLVKLIDSFLKDRMAHLNIQDYDYQRRISKGCPQGSPLSPTLWNLIIDDCLRLQLPENVKISAFADDINPGNRPELGRPRPGSFLTGAGNW